MRCGGTEEMLSAYANDELTLEKRESVEKHLAGCADCRAKLAGYLQVRQKLETLRTVRVAPNIKETMMARIKSGDIPRKPINTWGRRALVLVPVVAILAALLIIQPWSSFNGIQNTISKVHAAMAGIQSYRVSITDTNDEGGQTSKTKVEAEYVAPNRYHYQQTGDNNNFEFIVIGDKQYTKDYHLSPIGITAMSNSYSMILTKDATLKYLDMLTDIQQLPDETIEGTRCLHFRGIVDFEKVLRSEQEASAKKGIPPLSEEKLDKQIEQLRSSAVSTLVELWIGKDDYLIRQMKMEQQLSNNGELTSSGMTLKFSDFNQPITIEAPVDSSGNLFPGWTSLTPNQPALSKDIQSSIDNNDPANRRIKYKITLTNISGLTLGKVGITTTTTITDNNIWLINTDAPPSSNMPFNLESNASLKYGYTFEYDAIKVKSEAIIDSIKNTYLGISYYLPDGREQNEIVHFVVPNSLYTLPTNLPSNPTSKQLASIGEYKVDEPGATSAGRVVGGEIDGQNYLFVSVNTQSVDVSAEPGILVLNNENPAHPVKVAYLRCPENAGYIGSSTLSGNVLYVSTGSYLWIVDVSHPEAPRELASLSEVNPSTLVISGKYAYLDDGNQQISAVDISDPSHPQVIGQLPMNSRSGMRLDILGNYLLAWAESTLYTIDISSPASLSIVNSYTFGLPMDTADTSPSPRASPAYIVGEEIEDNYAYIALGMNGRAGMSIMDISDPVQPHEIAFLELNNQQMWGPIFVSGDRVYLFMLASPGRNQKTRFDVIDVSDLTKPQEIGADTLPDWWSFFPKADSSSYSASYNLIGQNFYWSIVNQPNQPVIEIFDLSVP